MRLWWVVSEITYIQGSLLFSAIYLNWSVEGEEDICVLISSVDVVKLLYNFADKNVMLFGEICKRRWLGRKLMSDGLEILIIKF